MWKPVPGYESEYEASTDGQFRRIRTRFGRLMDKPRILKFGDRRGYAGVTFCQEGKTKTFNAHRVTWETFNGPIPEGMQINHKNGDKRDNRLSNLEIVTPSENTKHGFDVLGRAPVKNPNPGTRNGRAKLSEDDVREIFRLRAEGWTQQQLANEFGVNQTGISSMLTGKTWKSVKIL